MSVTWAGRTGVLICGALGLLLFGTSPVSANAQRPTPAAASALVFDGVTVVDVARGQLVPNRRVVIVGNRIRAVENRGTGAMPKGARVVDAQGKYLIPGLWDTHTHIQEQDSAVLYPLSVANGVTGIRDAGSAVPLHTLRRWRREILAGVRIGPPRQMLSGLTINEEVSCMGLRQGTRGGSLHACVADTADAHHLVDSLAAAGADIIKLRHLSKAMYIATAVEAKHLGLPFGGHAAGDYLARLRRRNGGHLEGFARQDSDRWPDEGITSLEASDHGATIIDHELGGLDCWRGRVVGDSSEKGTGTLTLKACRERIRRFRRNGTWFVPTLLTMRVFLTEGALADSLADRLSRPGLDYFLKGLGAGSVTHGNWLHDLVGSDLRQDSVVAIIPRSPEDSLRAIRRLVQRELPVLTGTDRAVEGFNLHMELAMLVVAGWTPLDALRAATLNPAKAFRATDSLGTIAPGKLADLVLLEADPLADITNTTTIHAVVANGRYFDRAALDDLLAQARAANH